MYIHIASSLQEVHLAAEKYGTKIFYELSASKLLQNQSLKHIYIW